MCILLGRNIRSHSPLKFLAQVARQCDTMMMSGFVAGITSNTCSCDGESGRCNISYHARASAPEARFLTHLKLIEVPVNTYTMIA